MEIRRLNGLFAGVPKKDLCFSMMHDAKSIINVKPPRREEKMNDTICPLFRCKACGLQLYTWEASDKAKRKGCPRCSRQERDRRGAYPRDVITTRKAAETKGEE